MKNTDMVATKITFEDIESMLHEKKAIGLGYITKLDHCIEVTRSVELDSKNKIWARLSFLKVSKEEGFSCSVDTRGCDGKSIVFKTHDPIKAIERFIQKRDDLEKLLLPVYGFE